MDKLLGCNSTSILILGRSGSGKSTFMRKFAERKKKKLYIVGGDPSDFSGMQYERLDLSDESVKLLTNGILLIDDLIQLTQKQHAILRHLVCYTRRHRETDILTSSHQIVSTGLNSVYNQYEYIVFTRPNSSDNNIKRFLTRNDNEGISMDDFNSIPENGYLLWDQGKQESTLLTSDLSAIRGEEDSEEIERRRESLLKGLVEVIEVFPEVSGPACSLAKFILKNIDPFLIKSTDFCLTLNSSSPGEKKVRVSLIDYVLTSQMTGGKTVDKDLLRLNSYFKSKFKMPQALVPNPRLG